MAGADPTSPYADDLDERMTRLAEVLVDVDDRIAAEDAAAAAQVSDGLPASPVDPRSGVTH